MADTESVLDHPLISARYFFPRAAGFESPFWVDCEEARLACHLQDIDSRAPTVVHFHGNGEVVADYRQDFPALINRFGANCLLAEYRGYGASTGRPQLGRMLSDVACLLRAIDRPQERLVLFGRSVGSLFAVKALENFPRVAGLILESAVADPLERLLLRVSPHELGTSPDRLAAELDQQLNIRRLLEGYAGPVLILHTRHDGLIDPSHAERLAAWTGERAELVIFPQGSHNDIMFVNGPEYFARVGAFLARL